MTQEPVYYDGCQWPVDPACFDEEWEALDDTIKDRAVALASATLHRLTGYRVGGCPITVRPCVKSCWDQVFYNPTGRWMYPHINAGGSWVNGCGCTTDCSCTQMCEVRLPGPVGEVYAVTVGTEIIDPSDYRIDGTSLVWVGSGDCPWPACQDMAADVGEEGAFAVEYLNSYPVDGVGAYAAAVLAMEFAQACIGNNCRLPATVTSVSRQGVTFEIESGTFPGGVTGIREVDAYIGIWNPGALRQQSQVWSPDIKSPRVMR